MPVHSLFNRTDAGNILARLDKIKSNTPRIWGKMTVSQMLAHCSEAMETATGAKHHPRMFIGWLLGPFFKKNYLGDKPFPKGSPTAKQFIIHGQPDFATQKERLHRLICSFVDGGSEKCTPYPHSFFGKMAPEEWSIAMYKHLDHHFRQFGV